MLSGTMREHQIKLAIQPPVLEWLRIEAKFYGITVPTLIRTRLQALYEARPADWREKLKGG